jgi:SAM-dependent methyltransferase
MFPDVAASMAGAYDVVSMHHYLEHTREPLDELDAAATALVPGGHLLIELPDPESQFPRLVGRWWIPWFQPQHQHLIPLGRLKEELDRHGFDVVAEDRATAHQTVDFVIAAWLWLNHFVPADSPWTPKGSPLRGLARIAVVAAGAPLLVAAFLGDQIANVFIQRSNRGNTYRVLARRR